MDPSCAPPASLAFSSPGHIEQIEKQVEVELLAMRTRVAVVAIVMGPMVTQPWVLGPAVMKAVIMSAGTPGPLVMPPKVSPWVMQVSPPVRGAPAVAPPYAVAMSMTEVPSARVNGCCREPPCKKRQRCRQDDRSLLNGFALSISPT